MKKSFLFLALVAMTIASCSKDEVQPTKVVTFNSFGEFQFDSFAKTPNVTDIWYFDGNDLLAHQTSGEPVQLTLPYGQHSIRVIASAGTTPYVYQNEGKILFNNVGDTFHGSADITVNNSSPSAYEIELTRVVTQFSATITNPMPENVSKFKIVVSQWWRGVYASNGQAFYQVTKTVEYPVNPDMWGTTNNTFELMGFVPNDNWTTNIILYLMNGSEIVGEVHLDNIPFKKNRVSHCSGNIYDNSEAWNLSYDESWLAPYNYQW